MFNSTFLQTKNNNMNNSTKTTTASCVLSSQTKISLLKKFIRRTAGIVALMLFLGGSVWGQVNNYTFLQSTGTYTPITGGTQLYSGSFDDGTTSFALPFTFNYNNITYNNVMVATNGYLVFGASDPTAGSYLNASVISGTLVTTGAVSPWGGDLNGWTGALGGQTSEVRAEVIGTAPNRTFVAQWRCRPFYATSTTAVRWINFQVRLNEGTNTINIVYGPNGNIVGAAASSTTKQIGLRGATNTDFNNRTNTTSLFNTSIAGTLNTSTQAWNAVTSPPGPVPSGLTYTWSPPVVSPCSGIPSPGNTLTSSAIVGTGSTVNLSLSTPPTGSGLTYQWQSGPTNTGAWTNVGTSTATYVPTVSATTWYRCIVTCSGVTGTSAPVQVTAVVANNIPSSSSSSVACGTSTLIYDHAGASTDYSTNANGYIVLNNNLGSTSVISLTGTYATEANYDYLRIYNGTGTAGTQIASYSGSGTITPFTSSAGQTITVQFTSDVSGNAAGISLYAVYSGSCAVPACSDTPNTPVATLTGTSSICSGLTKVMTATGFTTTTGIINRWKVSSTSGGPYVDVIGGIGSTTASYTTAALTAGTYYYVCASTCTNSSLTSTSNELAVTVNALPAVSLSAPNGGAFCGAQQMTASGALTYAWTPALSLSSSTGASVTYTSTANATVSVTGTGENGCTATASQAVVYTAPSTITMSSTVASFCGTGGTSTITASSSAPYSYVFTALDGAVLSNATASSVNATVSQTSAIMVTGTDASSGCVAQKVYSVGLYPLPTASVTTSASGVCPGTAATINSGLSAGNFSVTCITHNWKTAPASAFNLALNGVKSTPPGGLSDASLDDGKWGGVPIGFNFNYFGTSFNTCNVGTNGVLNFGNYASFNGSQYSFPNGFPSTLSPLNTIGVLATDFYLNTSGSVKYWTEGYAPNRIFVLEYNNGPGWMTDGIHSAQCHLFETTGLVEIHVKQATGTGTFAGPKTIGLQDGTGLIGAIAPVCGLTSTEFWDARVATIQAGSPQSWRFSPPSDFSTLWTVEGAAIADGTNIFTQVVSQSITTTYDISYSNLTTGCTNEPNSAQITVYMLGDANIGDFAATASVASICPGIAVPLSHTYVGSYNNSGLSYQWQSSVDGGTTWSDIASATLATYSAVQSVATSYRVRIQACSGTPAYSSPVAISVLDFMTCYCTPNAGGALDEEIFNVTLSTLNNSSTCTTVAPGLGSVAAKYGNYSTLPATNLFQAQPVSGSLTISSCGTVNYSSGAAIFIDYNHNGSFTDAGERVWSNGSAYNISCVPASTVSASFTPPLTSLTGLTTMRIINAEYTAGDNILPCTSPGYGEVEDYRVNIIAPLATPATPLATNFGNCQYGDTISMVGTAPSGVTYYWQTTANGTSLNNSASTWIVYASGTYYIRAYRAEFSQWSPASSVTINNFPIITPPMAPENLSGTPYCAAVTLQAATSTALATSYYWQGTNPIGTSIALPATVNATATASGTYYIAARNDTTFCWSVGTSISVVVYPAPTGTAVASQPASCLSPNGSVLFNVSGVGGLALGAAGVISSDFSTATLPAGATLAGNNALIVGGQLRLTSAANSMNGGILIPNPTNASSNNYQIDFDLITTSSGSSTPADGFSYSYGPDVVAVPTGTGSSTVGAPVAPGSTNPENGSGSNLKIAFDAYTNGANTQGIYAMYNAPIWNQTPTSTGVLNYSNNVAWRATATAGATTHVTVKINDAGQLSMLLNGAPYITNQQLPASYLTDNKALWKHALSARTGGLNQGHFIDNLNIQYGNSNMFEYSIDDNTWTTTNPISAAPGTYNASVRYAGVGGCVVSLGSVTIAPFSINQVAISAPDVLACPGEVMTINAVVSGMSNNLTYQWQRSIDNGVTWADIAGATSTSVSAAQTVASLYRLGVSYCTGEYVYTSPLSIAMDYIAEPTITVSSSESSVCYGTPVTFTANIANEGTLPSVCNYTFNKLDSDGDGWNGNTMSVLQGTTVVATLGLASGSSAAQTVSLQSGLTYTLFWNLGGSFAGEVGVSVVDPSGTTIYNMPYLSSSLRGTTLTTITPNCTSTATESLLAYSTIAWQVNGVAVSGANGLTYTTSSLISGQSVTASVRINYPCLSDTVVSLPAALVVAPALIPTVTVASSASSVCQGTSVTFTATGSPANVGGSGTSCNYTFNKSDLYADGWDGAQMRVMNGTTIVATLDLLSGGAGAGVSQTVSLQSGISYSLVWNTAGLYPEEVGVSVVNASGVTVYSMGFANAALAGTTLATIAADCPAPATYQWRLNGSPIAGVTGETYTVSALGTTDVITVSYSTNAPCYSTAPVVSAAAPLVVVANTSVTTPVTATYSYTWADNGQTYTASGLYSGSVTNCVMQKLNLTILQPTVTFKVDMAQSNAPVGATPYVNGTYSMTNIGGTIWSATVPLPGNTVYEYKFTYNVLAGSENLAGSSCVVTSNGNRSVSVGTSNMVLPLVCWNSCSACPGGLTLKVFLDGYYVNGSSPAEMRAARYINLVAAIPSGSGYAAALAALSGNTQDVDLITVQLRSTTNTETILHTATPMLKKDGSVFCVFPESAIGGSYYVVVDHRASMPLWSQNPITLTTSSILNFANTLASAYSDGDALLTPMKTISSGLYGIWMGDLDQIGYLDAFDYSNLEGDIYESGYLGQYLLDGDLNGDSYVDATDFAVFDFNSIRGLYEQRPY